MPGPIPKRSDQRRRRNAPEPGQEIRTLSVAGEVKPPPASQDWHPVARRWYLSLRTSGQANYYEPSDWAYAYILAEMMTQGFEKGWGGQADASGIPPAAVLSGMASLLTTEGDRRRARLEIEREAEKPKLATVTPANAYRDRLGIAT
jgi:hypothetical protein